MACKNHPDHRRIQRHRRRPGARLCARPASRFCCGAGMQRGWRRWRRNAARWARRATTQAFDLRDAAGFAALLAAADARHADRSGDLQCRAGRHRAGRCAGRRRRRAAQAIAEVNFVAPVVGANAIAGAMAGRGAGQIVLVGSIAESYPAAHGADLCRHQGGLAPVRRSAGHRAWRRHGVTVTLVSPGFIDTPMSRKVTEPKPFLMTADAAAADHRARDRRGRPHHRGAVAVRGDPRPSPAFCRARCCAGSCRAHDGRARPWPGIGIAGAAGRQPLRAGCGMQLLRWGIPLALLVIIGRRLTELGWREIWIARPANPGFYILLVAAVFPAALRRLFRLSQSVGRGRTRRPWR